MPFIEAFYFHNRAELAEAKEKASQLSISMQLATLIGANEAKPEKRRKAYSQIERQIKDLRGEYKVYASEEELINAKFVKKK